ncbi:hypothetical protein G6F43_013470 [Rhizopus delemar]|nr:hypothetical protein G6F43_013470 [Rhizopus delemar]
MQVVRLRLSNLPFLGEKALLEGLKTSLQIYGEILDVGILLEPNTGTYMCTGYAILNVFSQEHIFEPLTHLIPWDERREQGFYAVWNQMPHYCRYCHEEGHVVVNCPKRRNRHTCWNCGENGHMAVSCTRDKPSKRARKQPETAPVVQPIVAQASVIDHVDVNEEVMETSSPPADSVPPVEVPTVPAEVITQNLTIVAATTPAAITIATKPSPKRLRTLIKKSPYERPTTRSSSATPPVLTSTSSDDMKLDSTEIIDNDAATDPSSSYHPAGEDNSNYLLQ